jgi:iron complex transport system ATP-binding protein
MRIRVDRVSFAYDGTSLVLDGIDLEVDGGEFVALIGPNGSGKSTLLRIISGVLRPTHGNVQLGDSSIGTLSVRRIAQRLAMVEQERPVGFDFTVREVVAMGRTPHRGRFARETRDDRTAIDRAMTLADVANLKDRSIRAVSGGERQRVFLAMALAQEPQGLLLDEPTTHLDLRHQVQFMSIVRQRAAEGATVVMAIHDLALAAQTTDRVALMHQGRILVAGPPSDVLTRRHIKQAFELDVEVGQDPDTSLTYVLPRVSEPGRKAS